MKNLYKSKTLLGECVSDYFKDQLQVNKKFYLSKDKMNYLNVLFKALDEGRYVKISDDNIAKRWFGIFYGEIWWCGCGVASRISVSTVSMFITFLRVMNYPIYEILEHHNLWVGGDDTEITFDETPNSGLTMEKSKDSLNVLNGILEHEVVLF